MTQRTSSVLTHPLWLCAVYPKAPREPGRGLGMLTSTCRLYRFYLLTISCRNTPSNTFTVTQIPIYTTSSVILYNANSLYDIRDIRNILWVSLRKNELNDKLSIRVTCIWNLHGSNPGLFPRQNPPAGGPPFVGCPWLSIKI